MALPIKPTPNLKGKDAERFLEEMEKTNSKKLDPAVRERMEKNYNELKDLFKEI
jgi:HD-GYP domain-containing protein (c-di-GMP phosphodiesterase class II)